MTRVLDQVLASTSVKRNTTTKVGQVKRVIIVATHNTSNPRFLSLSPQLNSVFKTRKVLPICQYKCFNTCHFGKGCIGNRSRRGQLDRVIIGAARNCVIRSELVMRELDQVLA